MPETGGFELLKLVGRRIGYLERLAEERLDKRGLEGALATSRSTVDRAVKELERAGLIRWAGEGYETTPAGRLLARLYRQFLERAADVLEALDVLGALPADAPVEPALLAGCEATATDGSPYELPAAARQLLEEGEAVVLVPAAVEPAALEALRERVAAGAVAEVIVDRALLSTLREQFPALAGGLAAGDATVREGPVPGFGLVVAPEAGRVALVAYGEDGAPQGVLGNDAPGALEWARALVGRVRADAADVTEEVRELARPAEGELLAAGDGALEAEGFVELSAAYFGRREPAPLSTGWRAGLDVAAVQAGQAVERERAVDGGRRPVAEELLERLRDGRDVAVLGPPGSGKSTVLKAAACRWYEAGYGPVLYREGGAAEPFRSWPRLVEALEAADGHALVVVEDAVRPEASAVFRAMTELRGHDGATFLVDAREGEWRDPPSFPVDAELEAYRTETVETVAMPPLDAREVERFVERFEAATGHEVAEPPARLLAAVSDADADAGEAAPAALQLLVHRLSLRAAPLAADSTTPTTLVEDVRRTLGELRGAGEAALEAGVLANLLNAAGMAVRPAYLHAAALEHGGDHEAVREALAALEGRALFDAGDGYRTVHESWSAVFLRQLLAEEGERAAADRFGRAVTALLALADDPDRRGAVDRALAGEAAALDRIEAAPAEWAAEAVERLFGVGREHPGLAPLYGRAGYPTVELPGACPAERRLEAVLWRGRMYRQAGDLDRAEAEFEALRDRIDAASGDGRARELRARAVSELGTVARRRGDLDAAEEHLRAALDAYRELDDRRGVADNRKKLGNVAWIRGDLDAAERRYRQALEAYRELGDRLGAAYALHNLGNVLDARGDREAAERHYRQALEVYRELGDRRDEADCLNNLGVLAEYGGDFAAAADYYRESLERYRAVGDRLGAADGLANLGLIACKRGFLDRAAEYTREALERYRASGDRQGEANALATLGRVDRRRDDLDAAERRYRRALDIYREIDDAPGAAATRAQLARLARDRGDLEAAAERARAALAAGRDLGTPRGEATSLLVLGSVARRRGDLGAAEEHLQESRRIGRDLEDRYGEARTLAELGEVALARGALETARERLEEAADRFREGGAVADAVDALDRLATACRRADQPDAARRARREARELAADAGLADRADALDEPSDRALDEPSALASEGEGGSEGGGDGDGGTA